MSCPNCNYDLSEYRSFDYIDEPINCPNCNIKLEVYYDESYDAESGDEWGWFYFERSNKL